jgi:hypothetical protein
MPSKVYSAAVVGVEAFEVRSEVECRPCVAYVWPLNMRAIVVI